MNEWTDKTVDAGNNLTTNDASGQKKVDFYITAQFTADSVKPSRHFLVGDGRVHGNFTNTELSKGKKYEVYSRALTTWNSEVGIRNDKCKFHAPLGMIIMFLMYSKFGNRCITTAICNKESNYQKNRLNNNYHLSVVLQNTD